MSIFYDVEQNTLEWFQLRLGILTASEAHRIMTAVKRQISSQAPEYMYRLLAEWITGQPSEIEAYQSPWMERGQELEDEAIQTYEGLREVETQRGGFFTTDDGYAGCSPDRRVAEEGLAEIKCPLLPGQVKAYFTGSAADDHRCQIQTQLWITGRQWVDVFSYHPALILDPKRVYRDESFIADLARVAKVFIAEMLKCREALLARFPRILDAKNRLAAEAAALAAAKEMALRRDGLHEDDLEAILAAQRAERFSSQR